jgi:hypothetical protein
VAVEGYRISKQVRGVFEVMIGGTEQRGGGVGGWEAGERATGLTSKPCMENRKWGSISNYSSKEVW